MSAPLSLEEVVAKELPDELLMRRWFRAIVDNPPQMRNGGTVLWARVSETFACGSTYANAICRRHGFDPDARVRKR